MITRTVKLVCPLAILLLAAMSPAPATAQMAGFEEGGMMTQFAPMLEMMKKRMGKKRFGQLMQTVGPMMSNMMDQNGGGFGLGGMGGSGGFGGFGMGGYGGGGIPFLGSGQGLEGLGGIMSSMGGLRSLEGLIGMGGRSGRSMRSRRHASRS